MLNLADNPLITVVLPVFNGQEFLSESIESVINQTYKNWELIIVDDCSSDNSPEIIRGYAQKDERIRVIRNNENKKLPASLNIGFKEAKGEFYTWTSDDNYYYPEALEKMLEFLTINPGYGMVYAKCKVLGTFDGDFWGDTPTTPKLLLNFPSPAACFLYRKSVAQKIGEYDINAHYVEDHDYWLRLLLEAPIGNIDEELYAYRRHDKSLTVKSGDKAAFLSIDLAIKYAPLYAEKFPEVREYVDTEVAILEAIRGQNLKMLKRLKQEFGIELVYRKLEQIYRLERNPWLTRKFFRAKIERFFRVKAANLLTFWLPIKGLRRKLRNKLTGKDKIANKIIRQLTALQKQSGKPIIIYASYFDFSYPLVQRPHHFLSLFSDKGYITVACSYDTYKITTPRENLYLISPHILINIAEAQMDKILYFSNGTPVRDWEISKDALVFYELIDDLDLLGDTKQVKKRIKMFRKITMRKNTHTMVSADRLKTKALEYGAPENRMFFSKNAVNVDDFADKNALIPEIMKSIVAKGKPIIGYYGALTVTWFDFDLVKKMVEKHPEWEFVLIGLIYGDKNQKQTKENIAGLSKNSNFTYISPIKYSDIPSYARHFSVATIPFKINDITLGTSPCKIFEYMAMGLPIVTSPMPECKLYKSALIAKNADEFAACVKRAIALKNDENYQKTLAHEASQNTYKARVDNMIEIIEKHYKQGIDNA